MTEPYLIVIAAVAGIILVLVTASMFGVSRRAVEAEIRRVEEEEQADEGADERGDRHMAA
ncbi:MAG TPA: hypothetical protein VFW14_16720 [Gaiellales bacterium]|nr:hypothetical protein [Gaiellales bacterium]